MPDQSVKADVASPGDPAAWKRATRPKGGRHTGVYVYIDGDVLASAGLDPKDVPPIYKTVGYQRSRRGHSVIVTLRPAT